MQRQCKAYRFCSAYGYGCLFGSIVQCLGAKFHMSKEMNYISLMDISPWVYLFQVGVCYGIYVFFHGYSILCGWETLLLVCWLCGEKRESLTSLGLTLLITNITSFFAPLFSFFTSVHKLQKSFWCMC